MQFVNEIVLDGEESCDLTPTKLLEVSRRSLAQALEAGSLGQNSVHKVLAMEKLAPSDALMLAGRSCRLATKIQQLIEYFHELDTRLKAAAEAEKRRLEDHAMDLLTAIAISKVVRYRLPIPENMAIDLQNARTKIDAMLALDKRLKAEVGSKLGGRPIKVRVVPKDSEQASPTDGPAVDAL